MSNTELLYLSQCASIWLGLWDLLCFVFLSGWIFYFLYVFLLFRILSASQNFRLAQLDWTDTYWLKTKVLPSSSWSHLIKWRFRSHTWISIWFKWTSKWRNSPESNEIQVWLLNLHMMRRDQLEEGSNLNNISLWIKLIEIFFLPKINQRLIYITVLLFV